MKDADKLTLEAQAGQLFFVGFSGYAPDADAQELLQRLQPGGILLFQKNIENLNQICSLTEKLRAQLKVAPFLALDQEGGRVDRLKHVFSPVPSFRDAAALGAARVRSVARVIASELEAAGFNTNFAPVVDLALEGSVLGERAVSANAAEVAHYGEVFLEELSRKGILGCLKHFPGLGGARRDPHFSLPRIERSRRELLEEDMTPFSALRMDAAFVMMSHAYYPELDERLLPASLSSRIVTRLLRNKIGFPGIIITDDLTMGAVTTRGLTPGTFVEAIEAGNDMVLFSQVTPLLFEGFQTVVQRARESAAFRRRVDESAARVLSAKSQFRYARQRYRNHVRSQVIRQIERLQTPEVVREPVVPVGS